MPRAVLKMRVELSGEGGEPTSPIQGGLNTVDKGKVGAGRRSSCAAREAEAKKVTKHILIYVFKD